MFTPAQYVRIYLAIVTRALALSREAKTQDLKEDWPAGPAKRTYDYWLKGEQKPQKQKPQKQKLRELSNWLYPKYDPPWPQAADGEAAEYERRGSGGDDSLQFKECHTMRGVVDRLLAVEDVKLRKYLSMDEWGDYIVAYGFLWGAVFRHFCKKPDSEDEEQAEAREKRRQLKKSREYQCFQEISRRLIKLLHALPRKRKGLWSAFLDFNVRQNRLIAEWNCTEPEQRSNLSGKPHWQSFYEEVIHYLRKNERDVDVAHNALAWASVFNRTGDFPALLLAYIAANGGEPDWQDRREFDNDFDNFRRWLVRSNFIEGSLTTS